MVVTGGGTIAAIDDVRAIANHSSGLFSSRISEACLRRGASVWHVHAPLAHLPFLRSARFDLDADDRETEIETARLIALRNEWRLVRDRLHLRPLGVGGVAEYAETLRKVMTEQPIDVVFLAMAVSDFEPEPVSGKIDSDQPSITIRALRAPKVIQSVRDWAPEVYLVGFKLLSRVEPAELIRAASSACLANRADLTVANDLQTLREGAHTIHLVRPGEPVETLGPGPTMAEALVDRVFGLAAASRGSVKFAE